MRIPVFSDIAALFARIALGVVLIAHGWQKFHDWGLSGTSAMFAKMGVPFPTFTAGLDMTLCFVCGVLFIVGALTPVAGVLIAIMMGSAWYFAHTGHGLIEKGGPEIVLLIMAASLAIAAHPGKLSIDGLLGARRKRLTTGEA